MPLMGEVRVSIVFMLARPWGRPLDCLCYLFGYECRLYCLKGALESQPDT